MITLLALTVLIPAVDSSQVFPIERFEALNYRVQNLSLPRKKPGKQVERTTLSVGKPDGSKMSINLHRYAERRTNHGYGPDSRASIPKDELQRPWSGLPLGWECRIGTIKGMNALSVAVAGYHESLSLTGFAPATLNERGFGVFEPKNWSPIYQDLERILRETFARAVGLRLGDISSRTIAGYSVRSARCQESDRIFGDLKMWCLKGGWSVETNDQIGYFTLRKGAAFAVVPLAAASVKVGTTWHTLPDAVALKDGVMYAPVELLELLLQE